MTVEWLMGNADRPAPASALADLIRGPGRATAVAGVYDGISALLARQAGFRVLYLSGAGLSASRALPDLGLLTMEEVVTCTRDIVRASGLPVVVDCDTGFGEALNIMRVVRELESAGAACIQIEDQRFPKKCGHLNDKQIVPAADMCRKIEAAKRAASNLLVCARTDAAEASVEDAVARARRYADAGADIVFVEALTDQDTIRTVRESVDAPLLANMTEFGRTPYLNMRQWTDLGYQLVIFPVSGLRVAMRALQRFYADLIRDGEVGDHLDRMMTRKELYDVIRYFDYEACDASIARTVLE